MLFSLYDHIKFHSGRSVFFIFIFVQLFLGCNAENKTIETDTGDVVKIIDGDTYDIQIDGKQTRIRMYGIDAPEKGMDFYKVSKNYLGALCKGNQIKIQRIDKDRYGRIIAKSYLPDGKELGAEMIKAGLAWHFKRYSKDEDLSSLELSSRTHKYGIWSMDHPTPPWEYRKKKKGN